MDRTHKGLTLAAVAGLLASVSLSASADKDKAATAKQAEPQIQCLGINACKGKASCHGPGGLTCAGQNTCKKKGWIHATAKECAKKGGKELPKG